MDTSSPFGANVYGLEFIWRQLQIKCVGLQATKELPAVKVLLKEAEEILGYDLLKLCTEGPKEKLDDTTYAQVPTSRL